jgi:hypothetical protein
MKRGFRLAKTLEDKVAVLTVVPPFHVVAVDPTMVLVLGSETTNH